VLGKSLKMIVGILAVSLMFAGIAMANPGKGNNSRVVEKKVIVKNVNKNNNNNSNANSRGNVVNKKVVIVKKPQEFGTVSGKTLLDTKSVDTTTVETSTPFGAVQLRLYVAKKTKWGIEQYKTAYVAKSNKNGEYKFTKVVPGSYLLKVWSPIALPVSDSTITAVVKANEDTKVSDIHFTRLGSIVGKTLLDISKETSSTSGTTSTVTSSEPLANVHLRLYDHKKTRRGYELFVTTNFARSDSNGQFVLKNVRPGKYTLKIWSSVAIPVNEKFIEVNVIENGTVTIPDIHLKPRPTNKY